MAYLNKGLRISLVDERSGPDEERKYTFLFEGGIRSFVRHLNQGRQALHEAIYVKGASGGVAVEVAIQYNDTFSETLFSFANNINTVDGATHLSGFRTALTQTLNEYARKASLLKDADPNLTGDEFASA
jgi:DNA gyrase subunit B